MWKRTVNFGVMLLGLTAAEAQILGTDPPDRPTGEVLPHRAGLVVSSNVNGASVYIDSLFLGVTPLEHGDLDPGVYRLRVVHPNRRNWYRESIEDSIELNPDKWSDYNARFEYVYQVHSIPFGARIFYNNVFKGETPAALRTPQPFVGSLLLRKDGYEDATFELNRWNGQVIEVPLTRLRGIGDSKTFLDVETNRMRHKTPILISSIVGIASGVAAVYFKQQADDAFNEYERTRDPKLLSRTDRYDTISGVSLVAFEVSLASLAFLLLSQ